MKNNYSDSINVIGDITEGIGQGSSVSLSVCDRKLTAELSEDFTLPDYLPEIRKLLRVNVTPSAPSKFISGSSAQFNGNVEYSVLYVGADGKCHGATFPGEYSFNAPFDGDAEYDMNEGLFGCADVFAESVVGRVNSARKMNVKSRLAARATVVGAYRVGEPGWLGESVHADTRRLVKSVKHSKHLIGSNDEIELRDVIDLSAERAEYLGADCGVFLEEVRAGEGYADCRGTVRLKYLLRREEESTPYTVERRLPLSDVVEVDGMKEGMACTAFCTGCGIDTKSEEGEGTGVECIISLRLVAHGFGEEKLSYVSDAFSTLYDSKCIKTPIKLPSLGCCAVKNMTFDGVLSLDKQTKPEGGVRIVDTHVIAAAKELTACDERDGAVVSGGVTFNVLCGAASPDGGEELFTLEQELPFKIDVGSARGRIDLGWCHAIAIDPRAKLTSEGLEVSCEIGVSCCGAEISTVERVTAVDIGEKTEGRGCGISICYPEKGESLWEVAKKHRVCPDRVASENGLDSDLAADDPASTSGVKYLVL